MHRARLAIGLAVALAPLLVASVAPAQRLPPSPRPPAPSKTAVVAPPAPTPTPPPTTPPPPAAGGRPGVAAPPAGMAATNTEPGSLVNLAVVALTSNTQCELRVMMKNQGAALPDSMETVRYWAKTVGAPTAYEGTVPAAQLRAPGSTTTVTVPGLTTAYDKEVSFTASVQTNVRDHRPFAFESTVTNPLKCGAPRPRLDMRISWDAQCRKIVDVRNVGGDLPGANQALWFIQRTSDGWSYQDLTDGLSMGTGLPSGTQKRTVDPLRTFESYSYRLTSQHGPEVIADPVPERCRGPKPDYRIELGEVKVDSQCRVTAEIRNTGTVAIPGGLTVPMNFRREGASFNASTGSYMGIPVGGAQTVTSSLTLGIPTATVTVTATPPTGPLTKTQTMNCQK